MLDEDLIKKQQSSLEIEKSNENGINQLWQLCLEKTSQMFAITMAMLLTATISYFAGPKIFIVYLVVLLIPFTLIVATFPRILCIKIRGISLTSTSSNICYILLYWAYWICMNYVFLLGDVKIPYNISYIIPLGILLFLMGLFAKYGDVAFFVIVHIFIIAIPSDSIGIFREDYKITITRVALYFFAFYVVEFTTKISGLPVLPYLAWILLVWKWILPLFLLQLLHLFFAEYVKRDDSIFRMSNNNNSLPTTISSIPSPLPKKSSNISSSSSSPTLSTTSNKSTPPTRTQTRKTTKKSSSSSMSPPDPKSSKRISSPGSSSNSKKNKKSSSSRKVRKSEEERYSSYESDEDDENSGSDEEDKEQEDNWNNSSRVHNFYEEDDPL
jgi:hypothetical protein